MQTNNKCREALVRCVRMLNICLLYSHEGYPSQNNDIREVMYKANAALSAPVRSCEKCRTADDAMRLAIDAGAVDCNFGAKEMAEFLLAEVDVSRTETTTKESAGVGNGAKMREALLQLRDSVYIAPDGKCYSDIDASDLREICDAALSAPPRNCDVWTAGEQDKKFTHQFCRVSIDGCTRCKLNTLKHRGNTCGIHWAQMPYEEGGSE